MKVNGKNIFDRGLFKVLKNMKNLGIDKDWILKNIDIFDLKLTDENGWNALMYIIRNNKKRKLGFTKNEIFVLMDKFDLNHQAKDGRNLLMMIIYLNKDIVFTEDEILGLLNRFDLTQENYLGNNVLYYILTYNRFLNFYFSKENIIFILDKFNLERGFGDNNNIYNFLSLDRKRCQNSIDTFNDAEMAILVSKLDVEMKDIDGKIILIKELEKGLLFDSNELIQKILKTNNNEVVNGVYKYINQFSWKEKDLFFFLKKNNFNVDNNVLNIL